MAPGWWIECACKLPLIALKAPTANKMAMLAMKK